MPKSPQVENGHTDIANEIAEQLAQTHLSPYETRVLWVLFRKTYGWHKHCDHISYTQWVKLTGLKRWHVSRTLSRLQHRLMIVVFKLGGLIYYGFQKDYELWRPIPEREEYPISPSPIEVTLNSGSVVTHTGDKALPKWVTDLLPKWVTSVSPIGVTKSSPIGVNTKEKKESTITTIVGPTQKEKEYLEILKNLPGWDYQEAEDLEWLRDLVKEFPNATPFNLKSCREYHSEKPVKKGPWKNRIRQWLQHDSKFAAKGKGGKQGSSLPTTEELEESWGT